MSKSRHLVNIDKNILFEGALIPLSDYISLLKNIHDMAKRCHDISQNNLQARLEAIWTNQCLDKIEQISNLAVAEYNKTIIFYNDALEKKPLDDKKIKDLAENLQYLRDMLQHEEITALCKRNPKSSFADCINKMKRDLQGLISSHKLANESQIKYYNDSLAAKKKRIEARQALLKKSKAKVEKTLKNLTATFYHANPGENSSVSKRVIAKAARLNKKIEKKEAKIGLYQTCIEHIEGNLLNPANQQIELRVLEANTKKTQQFLQEKIASLSIKTFLPNLFKGVKNFVKCTLFGSPKTSTMDTLVAANKIKSLKP